MERYDAQRALQHPWITRNSADKIPLTIFEEMRAFELAHVLKKVNTSF
jgi:hypothetical protein